MLKSKSNTVVIYKTMKIVICDDEAVFVNVIESQLRNYAAKIDFKRSPFTYLPDLSRLRSKPACSIAA